MPLRSFCETPAKYASMRHSQWCWLGQERLRESCLRDGCLCPCVCCALCDEETINLHTDSYRTAHTNVEIGLQSSRMSSSLTSLNGIVESLNWLTRERAERFPEGVYWLSCRGAFERLNVRQHINAHFAQQIRNSS